MEQLNSHSNASDMSDVSQYLAHIPSSSSSSSSSVTESMSENHWPSKRRKTNGANEGDGGVFASDGAAAEEVMEEEETVSRTIGTATTRRKSKAKQKSSASSSVKASSSSSSSSTAKTTTTTTTTTTTGRKGTGGGGGNAQNRDENSLRHLTTRFMEVITQAEDGLVDLNNAAQMLGVQKRRIYDITNVLEGIGLIDKRSKNLIQWKNTGITISNAENANVDNTDDCEDIQLLQKEISELELQDRELDKQIESSQAKLRELTESDEYQERAYVTYNDIRNIESLRDRTIIAIRAPSGTTLTVPDPDEGLTFPDRRYQIYLNSPSEPIKVYLLSNDGEQQQQQQGQHQQGEADATGRNAADPERTVLRQLEPPATDPDFIYSMDTAHEGITDLYQEDMGRPSGLLFDTD